MRLLSNVNHFSVHLSLEIIEICLGINPNGLQSNKTLQIAPKISSK